MVKVSVREFAHDLAAYLKRAEAGEDFLITLRNRPLANVTRCRIDKAEQGWKRPIKRVKLTGKDSLASSVLIKARQEERY